MGHKSRRIASHRRRVRARRARKTRRVDRASRAIKRARRRARVDGATTRNESMRTRDDDDFDESATRATTRDAASDDPTSPLGDDYERMLSDALAASLAATDAPVTKKIERWVRALGAAAADADDADDARDARSTRSSAKRASNSDARKTLDEMSRARDHGVQETAVDEEDLDADVDAGLRERDAARRLEKYGANDWTSGEDGDEDARGEEASARGADAGRARTRFARFLRAEIRNPTARVLATGAALELAQSFNARARDDPTFNAMILLGLVLGNAWVSHVEREDALRASRELTALVDARATVTRSGTSRVVDARFLVPGDIVTLTPGCAVPADCVSCGPQTLVLDNSLITGDRHTVDVAKGEPLFARGVVKRGSARAMVVRTGKHTFAGRAARVMRARDSSRKEMSAFDANVSVVERSFAVVGCASSLSVFLYLIVGGKDFFRSLSFAVILLIISTPLAIRTIVHTTTSLGVRALAKKSCIVARARVIEDLALMNVLCVDKTGTLTKDAAKLSSIVPTVPLLEGVSEDDVMTAAAMGTRWKEPPTNAVDAMILDAFDVARHLEGKFELVEHRPFDAAAKRKFSESIVRRANDGSTFRVMKGPIDVALEKCVNRESARAIVDDALEQLQSRAAAGVISRALLVACSKTHDDSYVGLGLIMYDDVRRKDAHEMLHAMQLLGVDVKIVTGDVARVARVACDKIGFDLSDGSDGIIHTPSDVPYVPLRASVLSPAHCDKLDRMKAYAEMLPEDKHALVKAHRAKGDVVGLVSDGASDSAALQLANVGVSMNNASDAARCASDIILAAPSLAALAHAVLSARVMFARVREYIVFRATCTAHVLGFFVFGALVVSPKSFDVTAPDTFTLPVIALCVNAALNDVVVIGTAYDHTSPSRLPERWNLLPHVFASAASGFTACFTTLALLRVALSAQLPYGEVQTCVFLKLTLTDAMTVFSARAHKSFLERRPGGLVLAAFATSLTMSCLLSANWPFMALASISWARIAFVFVFALCSFALQDFVKTLTYRALLRAGWMENVGVVSAGERARISRAVDRAAPKTPPNVSSVSRSAPTPVHAKVYDEEETVIERRPLLSDSEDDGFENDDESDIQSIVDDEFYSDYGGDVTATTATSVDDGSNAPERIAEMLEQEHDTAKHERLRRTPGYCMATFSDVRSITESHDWWKTFASLQRERIREHVDDEEDDDVEKARARVENDVDANDTASVTSSVYSKPTLRRSIPSDALTVLEMACGVGTFSAALCRHIADATREAMKSPLIDPAMERLYVSVDLLDVSAVALHTAAMSLVPPFRVGTLHRGSTTTFVPPQDYADALMRDDTRDDDGGGAADSSLGYDIVYTAHGFATTPRGKLHSALRNFRKSLRPGGLGFIAAATEQSHDAKFFAMYHAEKKRRGERRSHDGAAVADVSLTCAEQICDALSALGASYNVEVKSHVTAVDVENLEPYLHGVAMDDALSLDTMMSTSASLGAYLASCLSGDGTAYRFPQRVAHVTL